MRFNNDLTIKELEVLSAKLHEKNIDCALFSLCVRRWREKKKAAGEMFMLQSLPMTRVEVDLGMRSCGVCNAHKVIDVHFEELSRLAKTHVTIRAVLDAYKSGARRLVIRVSGDGKKVR